MRFSTLNHFILFLPSLFLKFLQHHARDIAGFGPAVSGDFPKVGGWKREGSSTYHSCGL